MGMEPAVGMERSISVTTAAAGEPAHHDVLIPQLLCVGGDEVNMLDEVAHDVVALRLSLLEPLVRLGVLAHVMIGLVMADDEGFICLVPRASCLTFFLRILYKIYRRMARRKVTAP